jgi:nucleoside-diphosphate-sugar epimerase
MAAKVLFLGGTGIISTACTELAVARGFDVWLLNRSGRSLVAGARALAADIDDRVSTGSALGNETWDAIVDFLAFTPAQIETRLDLFRGRVGHYLFISSASAYQKPMRGDPWIRECTPLVNPFWQYSRDKIACEERLFRAVREEGFPATVVRPSLTYGDTVVPLAVNSWQKSFTAIDRMRRGQPVIIPGDGLTPWTITHSSDFAKGLVGLLGLRESIGHAFHITSDEALSWNEIYEATATAAGVTEPKFVHLASDFLIACLPEMEGTLRGDKANAALFDNTKIKRWVPDFRATTRFRDGIQKTVAWFDAAPERRQVDGALAARWDQLLAGYEQGLELARQSLGH